MPIPDFYAGPIETRIKILRGYIDSDVGVIYQMLRDIRFIRGSIPKVSWSRGMYIIRGIDDMLENYRRLISAVVTYLHFRGIAKDSIITALNWDNEELLRREASAESIAFKESQLMSMLD